MIDLMMMLGYVRSVKILTPNLDLVLGITLSVAKLMRAMMRVHVRSIKIHILHLVMLLIKVDIVYMVIRALVEVVQ